MTARLHVGTSGWSYKEWVGPVYPRGLKDARMLECYTALFRTCEINTTFYNIPNEFVVRAWDKKTPPDFTFAAKIHRSITHDAWLDFVKIGTGLNTFMNRMKPLDHKIHAYLLQLPPKFSRASDADARNLERFLAFWERNWPPEKLVVEFRNLSWIHDPGTGEPAGPATTMTGAKLEPSTSSLLSSHGTGFCTVIEPLLPPVIEATNPERVYIRFHGFGSNPWFNYNFSTEDLSAWATRIDQVREKVKDIHVYFNNHFSGYAVKNAQTLMDFLDVPREKLEEVQRRFSPDKGQSALDAFTS